MTHLLPIGRFAQLTEMTVRALRFYDEVGLFAPEHVDQHSGYRYYDVDQLERAELIARLRRTSLPLDRIREYLDGSDPDRIRILDQHRARLHKQADATADAVRLIDRLSAQLGGSTARPVDATPIVGKTLWDQPVLCIRAEWTEEDVRNYGFVHDIADGVGVVLPTCDLVADKEFIEEVYASVERQGLTAVASPYFTCSQPDEDGVWRTEVGWPVDRPGTADGRVEPAVLPGGDVATTIYTGRFEDIAFAYRHLWTQILHTGFTPTGDPREIYVTEPDGRPAENYRTEVLWPIIRG